MASLAETLSSLDSSTVLLFVVFLISFAVLFFALMRAFKKNTAIASVIAGALSFLIVYGMSKMDWDIDNFFFDLGVSEDAWAIAIPIIALAVAIVLLVKLKRNAFLIFGGILIIIGLVFLEGSAKWIVGAVGGVLIGFRFLLHKWGEKEEGYEVRYKSK